MTEEEIKALQEKADKVDRLETEITNLKDNNQKILKDLRDTKDTKATSEAATKTTLESLQRELDAIKKDNEAKDAKLREANADSLIKEGLTRLKVAPQFHKAVTAMMKAEADLTGETAMVGSKTLISHMEDFLKSDEGSAFVAATQATGAGTTGSTGKIGAWQKAPETAEEYNRWMKYCLDNPADAMAHATDWKREDLKPA